MIHIFETITLRTEIVFFFYRSLNIEFSFNQPWCCSLSKIRCFFISRTGLAYRYPWSEKYENGCDFPWILFSNGSFISNDHMQWSSWHYFEWIEKLASECDEKISISAYSKDPEVWYFSHNRNYVQASKLSMIRSVFNVFYWLGVRKHVDTFQCIIAKRIKSIGKVRSFPRSFVF